MFEKLDRLCREIDYEYSKGTFETFHVIEEKYVKKLMIDYGFSRKTAELFVRGCEINGDLGAEKILKDDVLLMTIIFEKGLNEEDIIEEFRKSGDLSKAFRGLGKSLSKIEDDNLLREIQHRKEEEIERKKAKSKKIIEDIKSFPKKFFEVIRISLCILFVIVGIFTFFSGGDGKYAGIFIVGIGILIYPRIFAKIRELF